MSAPSKTYTIQSVKVRPEERLATTSELNPAPGGVTHHREARGMGYWAATQVKGLSPEITNVREADTVHNVGRLQEKKRQGEFPLPPSGSKTAARYDKERVGTWEAQCSPVRRVCDDKPNNGEESQMLHWESDQFIVAMKPRNGGGAKGLAGKPLERGHIVQTLIWGNDGNAIFSIISILSGEVFLKSRMREICTSGSVRGFIVNSERRWL